MKAMENIYPIYFLYGPEDYLIEEEIQKLMDRCLSSKERDLNLHLFSGEEHSGQEIVQTAQTLPMFAQYRFVLVNKADRIDKREMEILLRYIEEPSPTTCLVIHAQTLGQWKGSLASIERVGRVREYPRLKGMALVSWIRKRMLEKGKTLTEDGAEYLVEVMGDHLQDMENTLEKVSLSVGEKKKIELSDVEGIASEVKISTVYDLMDAISRQNLEKALEVLEKAMESKTVSFKKEEDPLKRMDDPVPLLISMIAKQYWGILGVKKLASDHMGPAEISKELKMSSWNVKKMLEQSRNFSESSLREGMMRCHQTDLSIKRGQGPKDLLVEKLVIDLCRPKLSVS